MKKVNIAIIGTIGVGKSTLLNRLAATFNTKAVEVRQEPSVSVPYINKVLQSFYKDTKSWAYPLQLSISATNEVQFEELRLTDYDYLFFDMPYSSFIYDAIHEKNGRMTHEEKIAIDKIHRGFPFQYLIHIKESAETTIERVSKRNKKVASKSDYLGQQDVEIEDYSYLYEHIKDFREFENDYIEEYFKDAKLIELDGLPDENSHEYVDLLNKIHDQIERGE